MPDDGFLAKQAERKLKRFDGLFLAGRRFVVKKSTAIINIGLTALAVAAFFSTEAPADGSASTQFTVNAQAPSVCSLASPQTAGTATNATFASNAVNIAQFIDPNNAHVISSSLSLKYPGTLCSCNATLSIQSKNGGLVLSNAAAGTSGAGTSLQHVPYTVQVNWGPVNLLLDTTNSSGGAVTVQGQTGGAVSSNLTLNFATVASSTPASQGSFRDTVLIKIGTPM